MSRQEPIASAKLRAEKTMRALLRTPKTREGLIAAVTSARVSRRFVFGWLSEQVRTGNVSQLKSGEGLSYQIRGTFITEPTRDGSYPAWLEPRVLPTVLSGSVFVDGVLVTDYPNLKEEEQE